MASEQPSLRERAEQRVRQRHERERSRLFRQRQAQREEMLRRQAEERVRHSDQERVIAERRKETLDGHDLIWERERQRLANSTRRTPGLGLFGGSQRDLQAEYHERRERWEKQRTVIEDAFRQQHDKLNHDRIEMTERHGREQTSQERWDRFSHDTLVQRQARTFENAVEKELRRGERTTSRTFTRHARETGRDL